MTTRLAFTSDDICCFTQDPAGSLWIGTADGLLQYSAGIFHRYSAADGLPAGRITSIAAGSNSSVFLSSPTMQSPPLTEDISPHSRFPPPPYPLRWPRLKTAAFGLHPPPESFNIEKATLAPNRSVPDPNSRHRRHRSSTQPRPLAADRQQPCFAAERPSACSPGRPRHSGHAYPIRPGRLTRRSLDRHQ